MSTPLFEAAKRYAESGFSRLHMPGHKGQPLPGLGSLSHLDLTEVTGLDSLYEAEGAIAATEAEYTKLYGTAASLLSAGGSTLCIQAMLALTAKPGGKILAARGVHVAAVNAMALLDLQPIWILPEQDPVTGLAAAVSPESVRQALEANPDAAAVYLTSPTYFGVISDIAAIKEICEAYQVPLLVDNAHGAHLKFLSPSLHPVDLGADLCCDSLHKTLPVLTGGALLHICNAKYLPQAKARMSLFGSTSPSYLIMLSADAALDYLKDTLAQDMAQVAAELAELSALAQKAGLLQPRGILEPLRLTLGFWPIGYTAAAFMEHLRRHQIEPEYLSGGYCVLMASGFNTQQDFDRVRQMLTALKPGPSLPPPASVPAPAKQALPLRDAMFSPAETIAVSQTENRIAAGMVTPCPPGIPLVVPGEQLTVATLTFLKNSGIDKLSVVK